LLIDLYPAGIGIGHFDCAAERDLRDFSAPAAKPFAAGVVYAGIPRLPERQTITGGKR